MYNFLFINLELKNSSLHTTLQVLRVEWSYDKGFNAPENCLTEEDFMPLLKSHQEGELFNKELKKLIDREAILELLDIDDSRKVDETRHHSYQFNSSNKEISLASYLLSDTTKTFSAQVSDY